MVSQISLDCNLCVGPDPENIGNKDVDCSVPTHEQTAPQIPLKKQTRQWAAWTRQEEESFFAALRQVGKNFEKITCRVQSKNKDQVRHYYYRLVRRMNKMLGPEFCLDAKNSKDTNAAMLRWWSLLEKYSCKASKLHLKPRRFKIFVETLENQLLRDRRKNTKKRLSNGESSPCMRNVSTSNQIRASDHDNRAIKMVLVDDQNIQKVGTGKGALFKRHVTGGINHTNYKVDPASVKAVKRRRRTGLASTAAYRRWEKAAIAGVSLVADAAEHLERAYTDKENVLERPGLDGSEHVVRETHHLQMRSDITLNENNNSTKLKLQLFPIDECTRKALEMDHHNPFLELTLSTRKKMSSILEHLSRKWGNSSFLSAELMLFPYWAQKENLVKHQKWTKESPLCAADVYYIIGSPPIFRLRYGWFSKPEVESGASQSLSHTNISAHNLNINIAKEQSAEIWDQRSSHNDHCVAAEPLITPTPSSPSTLPKIVGGAGAASSNSTSAYDDNTTPIPCFIKETGDLATMRTVEDMDVALSAGEWADGLTNISMGDLLSESTPNAYVNCTEFPVPLSSECLQQIPFSCDSFDAAIAAHIYKHQHQANLHDPPASHVPSIWDAEETCDAFAFQKISAFHDTNQKATQSSTGDYKQDTVNPSASHDEIEELTESEKSKSCCHSPGDLAYDYTFDHPSENSDKDFGALSDIYWPDSLGPLDLDTPSCRYHSNDLILSDSLGGLNRLIVNSLDAFQSFSFLGLDKKEAAGSTGDSYQTTSFSDSKISDEA